VLVTFVGSTRTFVGSVAKATGTFDLLATIFVEQINLLWFARPGQIFLPEKKERYSRLASTWSQNSYVQRCHQNRTQTFVLLNLTNAHPLNATHYCLYFVVGPFKTAVFAEKRACTASYLKHCSCCCWLQCFVSYSPLSATPQVKIISQNASLYFCFS